MTELSKVLGMEKKNKARSRSAIMRELGYEDCINDLDQREASVEKLTKVIEKATGLSANPKIAEQIIETMNINHPETWIIRKDK